MEILLYSSEHGRMFTCGNGIYFLFFRPHYFQKILVHGYQFAHNAYDAPGLSGVKNIFWFRVIFSQLDYYLFT